MAKDKKFVKLGEKANSFYDPLTKVKLAKGQTVELPKNFRESRRILRALKTGHLEYSDETENKGSKKETKEVKDIDLEKVDFTEKSLMKYKADELRNICTQMEVGKTEAELAEMTKPEMVEALLELEDEEEEEDED